MAQRWVCVNGHSGSGLSDGPCPECGMALSPVVWPASLAPAEAPDVFEETLAGGAAPEPADAFATLAPAELDSPQTILPGAGGSLEHHPAHDLATATGAPGPGTHRRLTGPALADAPTAGPHSRGSRPGGVAVEGYEVLGVLGRGGMGVVYKARQLGLNRLVALKMVLAGGHATDEELLRFRIEAEAVAALSHPNIVAVYEIGQREGRPFFSMEYCTGGSLQQKLQEGPMPPREAAAMLEVMARAMHYAHQHGIVHRDLKPANILLTAAGAPKVTDFGLAKRLSEDHGHTGTEAVLGTPTYMAPEQAEGKARLAGPPADVYALGAIFYDMLTGEPPFRGDSVLDTLHLVKTAEPVPPIRRRPGLPTDLQTICLKCLNKDAARRYASASELADDLRRFLDGKPIAARPTTAAERVWKWARRQPALAALVVLSFVTPVVIAALAVFYSARLAGLNEELAGVNQGLTDSEAALQDKNQKLVEGERQLTKANQDLAAQNQKEAQARGDAEKARDLARREKENALAQEQEAQRNFLRALEGVQELLNLARGPLRNQPGTEALRQQLLVRAARMADYFAQRPGDSPDARLRAARAHRLLGELRERLGEQPTALGHFEKAIGLYDGLLRLPRERWKGDYEAERLDAVLRQWGVLETSDPARAEVVLNEAVKRGEAAGQGERGRGVLLINRALHHQNRGQFARAEADYARAERLLEGMTDAPGRLELARLRVNRSAMRNVQAGLAPTEEGRRLLGLARADGEKAVAALTALRGERPAEGALANELGRAWGNLGLVLDRLGDRAEAARVYAAAVGQFGELARQSPRVVDYRHQLALARGNLGLHLLAGRDYDAAEKALSPARQALEGLVRGFPDMVGYRLDLVRLYNSEGVSLLSAGRFAQAEGPLERAAAEVAQAFRQLPAPQAPWREREAVYQNLTLLHDRQAQDARRRGDWPRAERAVGRLVELRRERARAPVPREVRDVADRAAQLGEMVLLRAELAATLRVHADVLLRRGRHAEAAAALAELTGLAPDEWAGRGDVAAQLVRCVRLAGEDRSLSPAGKARAARAYAEQALACLRGLEARPPVGLAARLDGPEFRALGDVAAVKADFAALRRRVARAEGGE